MRTKREWYRTSQQNKQELLRTEGILGCLTKVPFILAGDANRSPRICTFIFKALCKHQPLHLHTIAAREVNMYSSSILCFLEVQRSTGHFYSHSLCSRTKGSFWQPLPSWANEFPKATEGIGGRTGITGEILLPSPVLNPPCLPCNTPKQLAVFQLYTALL